MDHKSFGTAEQLYSCYRKSLELAKENGCRSIGFPLISAGIFWYPLEEAWEIAPTASSDWMKENPGYELQIVFVNTDDEKVALGKSILKRINAAAESSLSGTIGKKARIYPAASLFNESERAFNRKIAEILEACGYEVFLPQREGGCVPHPQEVEDGGWTAPENAGITDGLAEVFDKATADIEDFEYVPVGMIESQIVAGYTYRFLCKAPEDNTETEPRSAVVEIFVDLEGNAKVVNIMEVESRSM